MTTKTLNIALDKALIKMIDASVKKDIGSRSEYFRRLALADLDKRARWGQLKNVGQKVGKKMAIESEDQVDMLLHNE